jgi:hypothetical protein
MDITLPYSMLDRGSEIISKGALTLSIECSAVAERSWYPTIESISTVPADFTPAPDDGEFNPFRLF